MHYWQLKAQYFTPRTWLITLLWSIFFLGYSALKPANAQIGDNGHVDVISYHVNIRPDITNQSITGNVTIEFTNNSREAVFDCSRLNINKVEGANVESYAQKNQKLTVKFDMPSNNKRQITISYTGTAGMGLKFFPKEKQVHSAYATPQWMVCNNNPNDRATVKTDLIVPKNLTGIGDGALLTKQEVSKKEVLYSWDQKVATPAYTYGFVIGQLNEVQESHEGITLNYYAHNYSKEQLREIFKSTKDILTFLEKKSGVPYFQTSYSQLLDVGQTSQELVGLAILRNGYGQQVLDDSSQINLSVHELAHQWWGNMITCQSWNHFWLNEAMAVYMSSAYKEHRFGKKCYEEDIAVYLGAYQKVKDKHLDKPLVFDNWDNPTRDDRTIVYYKGAYVLHLLRLELGDAKFWEGIKSYSQQYYGKSVKTRDFQRAMENSSKRSLQSFFDKWVY